LKNVYVQFYDNLHALNVQTVVYSNPWYGKL